MVNLLLMREIKITYFSLIISVFVSFQVLAQGTVEGALTYSKMPDSNVRISAEITDSEESDPLVNHEIEFFTLLDSVRTSLGSVTTDQEGMAVLDGIPFTDLLLTANHHFRLSYEVKGEEYIETPDQFSFSDVDIKLSFEVIDSIKQIVVTISYWDADGNLIPLEEADAYLYVPRMFSMLPIGDIYTDEEGIGMLEFPTDLPGDEIGELEIIVQIEDHEKFGNAAVSGMKDWGTPSNTEISKLPRALWSPDAPLWMWITFIVLMTGVWFHYGWILMNLYKIRSHATDVESIIYED